MKKASSQSNAIPQVFSNLDGKQVWHITAPLGVPVSSIGQFALEAIASGEPVLTHKGVKYRLHEDSLGAAEKTKSLLLPDKHGNVFRRNRQGVSQTFHIEQVVDLPNGDLSVTPDIKSLRKKTPKQPKNLRMRYKPFGSSNEQAETFGSASEESEAETRSFKVPAGAELDQSSKKRKHVRVDSSIPEDSDVDMEPAPPDDLTRKKSKKTSSEIPDPSSHSTKSAKKDAKKRGREDKQQSPELRKKHREETSTERRARREERKRKKQQK